MSPPTRSELALALARYGTASSEIHLDHRLCQDRSGTVTPGSGTMTPSSGTITPGSEVGIPALAKMEKQRPLHGQSVKPGSEKGPPRPLHIPLTDLESQLSPVQDSADAAAGSRGSSVRSHLTTVVDPEWAWVPLVISSFVSGLNDSSAFVAWHTFTDMQTGNTILLALGASHQPVMPTCVWVKTLAAIVAFSLSSFILPRVQRLFSLCGTTRGALFFSWLVQACCLFVAGAVIHAGVVPRPDGLITPAALDPSNPYFIEMLPVCLMGFNAGGQTTSGRMLGFNEIPTVVLTTCYSDIFADKDILKLKNPKRDRRAASIILLLLGGIVGGWITRSKARMEAVLWLGAFLKFAIAAAWLCWRGKSGGAAKPMNRK